MAYGYGIRIADRLVVGPITLELFPVNVMHMLETRPTSTRSNTCNKAGCELAGLRFGKKGVWSTRHAPAGGRSRKQSGGLANA
jgi:hypothetical protein